PPGNTSVQSPQFWSQGPSGGKARCAGSYALTGALDVGQSLPAGSYAIEVTSTRTDTIGGTNVTRESAPSVCRTVTIASGQALNAAVSNVPGATGYNVYVSLPNSAAATIAFNGLSASYYLSLTGGTCAGPFYLLASIPVSNADLETNVDTSG